MPIPNTPLLLLQEQSDEDAYDDATQKFEPFVDGSLQPVGTVPPKEDPEKEANESKPLHPETPVAPPANAEAMPPQPAVAPELASSSTVSPTAEPAPSGGVVLAVCKNLFLGVGQLGQVFRSRSWNKGWRRPRPS